MRSKIEIETERCRVTQRERETERKRERVREQGVLNKELVFPMLKESIGNNDMVDISNTDSFQVGLRPARKRGGKEKSYFLLQLPFCFSFE